MTDNVVLAHIGGERRQQLHARRVRSGALSGVVPSVYLVWLLWDAAPQLQLVIWCLAVVVIDAATFVRMTRFLSGRLGRSASGSQWLAWEYTMATLLGLVWGVSGVWMTHTPFSALNVSVVLLAVSSIGVIALMYYRIAMVAFVIGVWIVPSVLMLMSPEPYLHRLVWGIGVMLLSLNFFLWEASGQLVGGVYNQVRTELLTTAVETAMKRAQTLADCDELTGIANRRAGLRALNLAIETKEPVALLLVDIDHFKRVNDTHGHPAGDAVLQAVAKRLSRALRSDDTVARVGGEEFLVIVHRSQAVPAAERLLRAMREEPIEAAGHLLQITASIGHGVVTAGESASDALARVDAALYRAKHSGRNCALAATASCIEGSAQA